MAKSKTNFAHQVIYTEGNHLVVTTPKGWARDHRSDFKDYTFSGDDVPRTSKIEKHLKSKGFKRAQSTEIIIFCEFKR